MVIKAKENIKWLLDNHCILIIGILYTITAFVVVGSAWIENIYLYDLNLTKSSKNSPTSRSENVI